MRPFSSVTLPSPYWRFRVSALISARVSLADSTRLELVESMTSPFMSVMSSESSSTVSTYPSSEMKPRHLKAGSSLVLTSVGSGVPRGAEKMYPPFTPLAELTFAWLLVLDSAISRLLPCLLADPQLGLHDVS